MAALFHSLIHDHKIQKLKKIITNKLARQSIKNIGISYQNTQTLLPADISL